MKGFLILWNASLSLSDSLHAYIQFGVKLCSYTEPCVWLLQSVEIEVEIEFLWWVAVAGSYLQVALKMLAAE